MGTKPLVDLLNPRVNDNAKNIAGTITVVLGSAYVLLQAILAGLGAFLAALPS